MTSRSMRIVQLARLAAVPNASEEDDSLEENFSPIVSNYSDNMSIVSSSSTSENQSDMEIPPQERLALHLNNISPKEKVNDYINCNTGKTNYSAVPGEYANNLTGKYLLSLQEIKQIREKLLPNTSDADKKENDLSKPEDSDCDEVAVTENIEKTVNDQNSTTNSSTSMIPNKSLVNEEIEKSNNHKLATSSSISKRKSVFQSGFLIENRYKKTFCKFCESDVDSKHFSRHLERNHENEKEVVELSKLDKKDPQRKTLITMIRNAGNLDAGIRGHIIPKRRVPGHEADEETYIPCPHCKSYFKKNYLCRHEKRCFANAKHTDGRSHAVIDSLIYSACQKKYGKILNQMNLKREVLSKMRGDNVAKEIMNDILIISWGDDLLKKTPSKRSKYHLTAKMRRCANFVINMRTIDPKYKDMLSCLKPEAFDDAIEATKKMSRYDAETRTFRSGSTALQFGAYLKQIADLTMKIVLRKKVLIPVGDIEVCLRDLKRFKQLVDSQWTTELGSLAMKDLNSRAANKSKLLPLTEDIMKLKQLLDKSAEEAYSQLISNKTMEAYKVLVETTLVSSILHNRKRVGDIQYLELESFEEQRKTNVLDNQDEFLRSLTQTEKVLIQNYTKVNTIGKGSRTVPLLIPKDKLKHYDMILSVRKNRKWFPEKNVYFFTYPKSQRWIDGTAVMRKYAKKCGAKQPQLITSSRLRKHIATVTQVLALKRNEIDQLAKFMGHTTRTHEEFYKLPQDVYQTAKVSKILQLIEKGNADDFKNKCLDEIEINMNEELSESDTDEENDSEEESTGNSQKFKRKDEMVHSCINTLGSATNAPRNEMEISMNGGSEDDTNEENDRANSMIITDHEIPSSNTDSLLLAEEGTNNSREINRNDTITNPGKKIPGSRRRWVESEKNLVKKAFARNIKHRMFPKKDSIIEFINKNSEIFNKEDDYVRIRTLVVNEYNKK